jgi:Family of unknown function (DUF6159)
MFDRISNGMALARSSWAVLIKDKHLILFPVVSGILFLIVLASFAIPMAVLVDWTKFDQQMQANNNKPPVWIYAVSFAFYFCTYFVIIFCNSALISCAMLRFNGQEPSLGDGFRMAMARLPQIFAWAVVSATVGVLLKVIENAHEKVGYYISMLLGTAWSIMTFFVVPVLVVEKTGPFEAVSRSVSLLKRTWGEALVGRLGLGFFLLLLFIPVALFFVGGILALASGAVPAGIALIVVGVIGLLIHSAIASALNTILLAALYQYAAEDRVPDEFDRATFAGAFQPKTA